MDLGSCMGFGSLFSSWNWRVGIPVVVCGSAMGLGTNLSWWFGSEFGSGSGSGYVSQWLFVAWQWVWVRISVGDLVVSLAVAVAVGMYLSGCLWLGGYGNFVEIFGFVVCQWCSCGGCWFVGCCGLVGLGSFACYIWNFSMISKSLSFKIIQFHG